MLWVGANAAQDAKHRLNEQRGLDDHALQKVRGRVEVADVIALDFKAGLVGAARLEDVLDVFEGVAKNTAIGFGQIGHFPVVLPIFVTPDHGVQAKVHRAHVERGDFGLELQGWLQALFDAHGRGTAGGEVEHHIRVGFDHRGKFMEIFGVLGRLTGDRVACMQMHDGGTRFGCPNGRISDLFWGDRQVR